MNCQSIKMDTEQIIQTITTEKVVRSGHSTQSHPETIEEVRRILLERIGVARKLEPPAGVEPATY